MLIDAAALVICFSSSCLFCWCADLTSVNDWDGDGGSSTRYFDCWCMFLLFRYHYRSDSLKMCISRNFKSFVMWNNACSAQGCTFPNAHRYPARHFCPWWVPGQLCFSQQQLTKCLLPASHFVYFVLSILASTVGRWLSTMFICVHCVELLSKFWITAIWLVVWLAQLVPANSLLNCWRNRDIQWCRLHNVLNVIKFGSSLVGIQVADGCKPAMLDWHLPMLLSYQSVLGHQLLLDWVMRAQGFFVDKLSLLAAALVKLLSTARHRHIVVFWCLW